MNLQSACSLGRGISEKFRWLLKFLGIPLKFEGFSRPGLRRAGSSTSGLLVAMMHQVVRDTQYNATMNLRQSFAKKMKSIKVQTLGTLLAVWCHAVCHICTHVYILQSGNRFTCLCSSNQWYGGWEGHSTLHFYELPTSILC